MDNDERFTHWCETCERPVRLGHEHPYLTMNEARNLSAARTRSAEAMLERIGGLPLKGAGSTLPNYSDRRRQLQMLAAELWVQVFTTKFQESSIDRAKDVADDAVKCLYQRFHDPYDGPADQQEPHFIRVIEGRLDEIDAHEDDKNPF